jgi:hypothetical protein
MNTSGLSRHYGKFTPRERLQLVVAASLRGDEAEKKRLAGSAPALAFRVPHHYGLASALTELMLVVRLAQLDLAASLRQSLYLREVAGRLGVAPPQGGGRAAGLFAYRLLAMAEAWGRLAGELGVDLARLEKDLPGRENLEDALEDAAALACTPQEAAELLGAGGEEASPEGQLRAMYDFLERRSSVWGGAGPADRPGPGMAGMTAPRGTTLD